MSVSRSSEALMMMRENRDGAKDSEASGRMESHWSVFWSVIVDGLMLNVLVRWYISLMTAGESASPSGRRSSR